MNIKNKLTAHPVGMPAEQYEIWKLQQQNRSMRTEIDRLKSENSWANAKTQWGS